MQNQKEWISLKVDRAEKSHIANAAKELGVPVSELLRRSLRIAIPVLTAVPPAGVKTFGEEFQVDEVNVAQI